MTGLTLRTTSLSVLVAGVLIAGAGSLYADVTQLSKQVAGASAARLFDGFEETAKGCSR